MVFTKMGKGRLRDGNKGCNIKGIYKGYYLIINLRFFLV